MKKLSLILVLLVLLSTSVFAADLIIDNIAVSPNQVNPGATLTLSVKVSNSNLNTDSTPVDIKTSDTNAGPMVLNLPDNNLASSLTVLASNSLTQTLSFTVPNDAKPGQYTATLTAVETDNAVANTVNLNYNFVVAQFPNFQVKLNNQVQDPKVSVNLESGEESNPLTLVIKNTGNIDLKNVQISTDFGSLLDDDGDQIVVTNPNPILELKVGQEVNVAFNFDVENGFDLVTLSGKLAFKSDEIAVPLTKNLELNIKPLACLPNSKPGDLELENDNLDDVQDQDYEIGDTVNVELEIRNNNEEDNIDTKVKAVLYNNDRNRKEDSQSLTKKIKDDDSEEVRFDFSLGELDDDDSLTLFLKIFNDDDELVSCHLEEADVSVEVPEHKVNIQAATLSPSNVLCGDQVTGSVLLRNVGDEDELVSFDIYSTQLGLSKSAPQFELEDLNSVDNEQQINFAFEVPKNMNTGTYTVNFKTKYGGEEATKTAQLSVTCPEAPTQPVQTTETTSTGNVEQQGTSQQVITGSTTYSDKNLFDIFKKPEFSVPTLVWVLLDVLLALLIISTLVWLFTRNR